MTINLQNIQEGRQIREEIMLEIEQARKGVFMNSDLSNSGSIRTSSVNSVANGSVSDPATEATVQALGDLAQIYMLNNEPWSGDVSNKLYPLLLQVQQLAASVTDPTMKALLDAAMNCFGGTSPYQWTISQANLQAVATFWTQPDTTTNPVLLASKYIESIPDFTAYDPHFGFALAMFDLSVYNSSSPVFIVAQQRIEKMLSASGPLFNAEKDMWKFLLCYALENGISTDSLLAMLPPAPSNCPEYTQLLADIKANAGTFPPHPGDPSSNRIWVGADLAAFMKLYS